MDPRTPSEWKRNFRSALNRKDGIEMVEDKSTDPEDPHKVYEINFNIASKELISESLVSTKDNII